MDPPRLVPKPRPPTAPAARTGPERPSPVEQAGLSALRSLLARSEGEPAPASARSAVRDLTGQASVGARVHRGPEADRVAGLLGTDGATVGPHVVLGAAATESTLVHELVHVAQSPEPPDLSQPLELGPHDSEAEAEARAATAGQGGGVHGRPGNVVRRSTELTGAEYIVTHEALLEADLVTRLTDPMLPLPLPASASAARWPAAGPMGGSAAFLGAVGEKLKVGPLELTLARVLPKPPVHIVDAARVRTTQLMAPESDPKNVTVWETDKGPSDYFFSVAVALADAVYQQVLAALPRMVERYLSALRGYLDTQDECPIIDSDLPAFALITSHPIDAVLAEVLVTHEYLDVDTVVLLAGPVSSVVGTVDDLRPVSWEHLGPQGLERWIRVLDPVDPTPEEAAYALYGRTDEAHLLTVVGTLVGFASTEGMLPEVEEMLALDPWQPVATSPLDQLMASDLADEASLAASSPPRPGLEATQVFAELRANHALLVDLATLAQRFGLGRRLDPAREHADALAARLETADAAVVVRWDGLIVDQRAVIVGATFGVASVVAQLDSMNAVVEDVGGFTMPQFARLALRDGAEAFVEAAALSHVPTVAARALLRADEQWRLLPATLAEGMLMGVVNTLHETGRKKVHSIAYDPQTSYDLPVMQARLDDLRQRVQVVKAQLLAHPDTVPEDMQRVIDDVRDLADEVQVVGVMDQMFAAWQALHDTNTFAAFLAFQSGDLRDLQKESLDWYKKWGDVRVLWLTGRTDEARAAAKLLAEDPKFVSFLGRVQAEIEDAQSKALIAQIMLMVAITLATMGIGAYVGGVVGGAMAGSRFAWIAAGGAAAISEGVAITTLQTLLLTPPELWTLDSIAIDLAWNVATFAALRGVAFKLRGAGFMRSLQTSSRTGRFVAFGIEHSANVVVLGGSEIGRALVEEARGHGPPLTGDQITERLEQGVLAYILIASVGALAKSPLEAIQHRGLTRGLRINDLRRLRLAMQEQAGKLQVKATDLDVAVLRGMVRDYWTTTRAATEQLLADPAALARSGLARAEVERLHALAGEMATESATFSLASRLRRVGPASFLIARSDLPRLLAVRRATGSTVAEVARDPISGMRTYEVTAPDGNVGRFIETLGAARPGEVEGGRGPTAAEAKAAREEMLDAIRVQARRAEQLTALVNARLETSDVLTVRHIVVGEGQAAVQSYVTRHAAAGKGAAPGVDVTEIPEAFAISEGPDMWRTIGNRAAGQPTSDWRSRGFTRQPSEFAMPGEQFGNALDIAAANALTAYESGIATYRGRVVGVETNPHDGTWASDTPIRVRVARPDGTTRLIYTQTIDLGIGPGPGRRLAGTVLDPAAARDLEADGRLLYGHESYQVQMPGEKVLFYGGGPTSLWGAMNATTSGGARRAVWLARPGDASKPVPDPMQQMVDFYASQGVTLTPQEVATFGLALARGNISGFTSPKIVRQMGEITSVRPGDPTVPGEAGKVMVSIDGGPPRAFDRLALSIGQDVRGPHGQFALAGGLQFKMILRGGRLVGLESVNPPGAVKFQGAVWPTANPATSGIADLVIPAERARFIELVRAQSDDPGVPIDSRGTPPSIHQSGKNIPRVSEPNVRTPVTPDPRKKK